MNIFKSLLLLGFFQSSLLFSQESTQPGKIDPTKIEVSLVPDKATFMLGEQIYVSFIVKNKSDQDLQVLVGGDYQNGLGRPAARRIR